MADTTSSGGRSRGFLIIGGILSLIVGFLALSFPFFFSAIIVQLLGAFAFVSGLISLCVALFGRHTAHRFVAAVSALIRIAAGLALLLFVLPGVLAITLVLAVLFLLEGVFCIVGACSMKDQPGWGWLLLNGAIALGLGLMLWVRWPSDAAWVIGLFYGINSIFAGTSLLMMGIAGSKSSPAPERAG